jgi:hypothetical protein
VCKYITFETDWHQKTTTETLQTRRRKNPSGFHASFVRQLARSDTRGTETLFKHSKGLNNKQREKKKEIDFLFTFYIHIIQPEKTTTTSGV